VEFLDGYAAEEDEDGEFGERDCEDVEKGGDVDGLFILVGYQVYIGIIKDVTKTYFRGLRRLLRPNVLISLSNPFFSRNRHRNRIRYPKQLSLNQPTHF
jgi:hypothetical protein